MAAGVLGVIFSMKHDIKSEVRQQDLHESQEAH